jgi:3-(3-hydroxy-phenyl)propionate hydroxylase
MEGSSYEAEYVIVDIKMETSSPIQRRAWFDPPWLPDATILMHGQPENIWRLDFQMRAGEKPEDVLQRERLLKQVASHLAAINEPQQFEIVWATSYRAHSRLLPTFNVGRIFFAGDSAHLFPIFGIRGLNSGVEDAFNLAWKLDYVLRAQADDPLLDSYSAERRAVALRNQALANRAADFMTPPTRGARMMRDSVLSLAVTNEAVRPLVNPRQATFIPLSDSPLNFEPDAEPIGGPLKPGDVLPNLRYGDRSLYELLDGNFSIVVAHSEAMLLKAQTEKFARLPKLQILGVGPEEAASILDKNGEIARLLGIWGRRMLVVRPDHHICAVADSCSLEMALDKAIAHAACSVSAYD